MPKSQYVTIFFEMGKGAVLPAPLMLLVFAH